MNHDQDRQRRKNAENPDTTPPEPERIAEQDGYVGAEDEDAAEN